MFQYALGRKLSQKLSSELKLDITGFQEYKLHKFGLKCFSLSKFTGISASPVKSQIHERINRFLPVKFQLGHKRVVEKSFSFDEDVLQQRGNLVFDGYWQSEKYFYDIRGILLNDFRFQYPQDSENEKLSDKIRAYESVSLHVRRGDYVNNAETLEKHGVCDLDYYYRAVAYVGERMSDPSFFIFSDDPDWAKENLKIDYPVTFISNNDASKNYEDLRLMSQCKHNIIANSSFSWWGAWLNENPRKIVIAPQVWFVDKAINTRDVIPESWVSL